MLWDATEKVYPQSPFLPLDQRYAVVKELTRRTRWLREKAKYTSQAVTWEVSKKETHLAQSWSVFDGVSRVLRLEVSALYGQVTSGRWPSSKYKPILRRW